MTATLGAPEPAGHPDRLGQPQSAHPRAQLVLVLVAAEHRAQAGTVRPHARQGLEQVVGPLPRDEPAEEDHRVRVAPRDRRVAELVEVHRIGQDVHLRVGDETPDPRRHLLRQHDHRVAALDRGTDRPLAAEAAALVEVHEVGRVDVQEDARPLPPREPGVGQLPPEAGMPGGVEVDDRTRGQRHHGEPEQLPGREQHLGRGTAVDRRRMEPDLQAVLVRPEEPDPLEQGVHP